MNLDLDSNQKRVIDVIKTGWSIFMTGEAGTGKSRVLSVIRNLPEFKHGVFFTSPTGIAANNINGCTIHSFAGIGVGHGTPLQCLERVRRNKGAIDRWLKCRVLVIDEISMVSKSLFEKLDFIARKIRSVDLPFGGIQLILSGDFYQLRPVTSVLTAVREQYCFESDVWREAIKMNMQLTVIHRQREGDDLLPVLRELRVGKTSLLSISYFRSLRRPIPGVNEKDCTTLFSKKIPCQMYNNSVLEELDGEECIYKAKDTGMNTSVLKSQCTAPPLLLLKTGARVVLLKNLSQSLVNGTIGTVVYFSGGYPVVRFENNETLLIKEHQFVATHPETAEHLATRLQLPLQLGWGITIHKSQGVTIRNLRVCLCELFESGQAYTALSRAVSGDSTQVVSLDSTLFSIESDPIVSEFYTHYVKPAEEYAVPNDVTRPTNITSTGEVLGNQLPEVECGPGVFDITEGENQIIESEDSLPNELIMEIIKNILESKIITEDCREDIEALLYLDVGTAIPAIGSYISWLWKEIHLMSHLQITDTEFDTCTKTKFWEEIFYPKLHALLISENARLITRSSVCLAHKEKMLTVGCEKTGLEELLADRVRLYHRMTLVSRATYKKFIQHVLMSVSPQPANNDNDNRDLPNSDLTPEMKGTLRYVAGWTLHKEIQRSTRYILQNAASKNKKVISRRKNEVIMRYILISLKGDKSEAADAETMTTIMRRDRGALTNVSDELYGAFEAIQRSCDSTLTIELLNNIDVNSAIARARNTIINDQQCKESWMSVFNRVQDGVTQEIESFDDGSFEQDVESEEEVSDGEDTDEAPLTIDKDEQDFEKLFVALCDEHEKKQGESLGTTNSFNIISPEQSTVINLGEVLYLRIMNKFLKVQLKSWKRKVVRSLSKEKTKALRERLTNEKRKEAEQTSCAVMKIQEIIDDTTDNRLMSYTNLKFNALRDRSVLKIYTRQELKLLFLAFGMRFPNLNKGTLCDILSDQVMKTTCFRNHRIFTSENRKRLEQKGGYKALLLSVRERTVDEPPPDAATGSASLPQAEPVRKGRRPNFIPKEEDKLILLRDVSDGKTTPVQARFREEELVSKGYDVDFRQVLRWYKAHATTANADNQSLNPA